MKILVLLLTFLTPLVFGGESIPEISTTAELKKNIDKKVILEGIYNNPGKGDRTVDCGFIRVRIQDYSFMNKSKEGYLVDQLKSGQKIRFVAVVRYYKGAKSLVRTHPIVQEASPPRQTINGQEYYVYPPSYSIIEANLIESTVEETVNDSKIVPELKPNQKNNPQPESKKIL